MSLSVEIAGYGVVHGPSPYFMLIICAQQQNFQAWTVYRRVESFGTLADQLRALDPGLPLLPGVDPVTMTPDNMENCRIHINNWLQMLVQNPNYLRTPSMYQFLCAEANSPPAGLEVHWRIEEEDGGGDGGMDDEMVMDDMFGDTGRGISRDERDYSRDDKDPMGFGSERISMEEPDDEDDGMDAKSLSRVEAEYMYGAEEQFGYNSSSSSSTKKISLSQYDIIKVIGKGSFGKVFLVREKATNTILAMKVLKKDYIIRKNQVEHTKTERSVLGHVQHPYIVGMVKAFQTSDKLFFLLDYCAGGELFFQLGKVGRFDESRAKFYASQITLALEYMHGLDIIYRDLKPENVLLDQRGNVRLTDFGLSKEGVTDPSQGANSFCGTPEYIAPEVLNRKGHGRAVDWWSLGALLYEMITGLPPFYSRNREVMFEKIMKAELTFPPTMTPYAKDLLSRLLVRDPTKRLGSGERDANELKEHPFFADMDWDALSKGQVAAPWVPTVSGSLDTSQFDQEFTSMNPIVSPDVREAYFGSIDKQFEGFSFVDDSAAGLMMGSMGAAGSYAGMAGSSATMAASLKFGR